jgi:hypothetical protein
MIEMSKDEIRNFLMQGTFTGKLAKVNKDWSSSHVVPIWFVLDDDDTGNDYDVVCTTGRTSVKAKDVYAIIKWVYVLMILCFVSHKRLIFSLTQFLCEVNELSSWEIIAALQTDLLLPTPKMEARELQLIGKRRDILKFLWMVAGGTSKKNAENIQIRIAEWRLTSMVKLQYSLASTGAGRLWKRMCYIHILCYQVHVFTESI